LQRVIFLILPGLEILDLAGPLQAFHEANLCGADYDVLLCSPATSIQTEQGLRLADLQPLCQIAQSDMVVVPGVRFAELNRASQGIIKWLCDASARGAQISSVCTGAFILGYAGLLDGRQCTTHWSRIEELQRQFPNAKVITNRLFVDDGQITTSAGIASGIDLTLSLIERRHGPRLTAAVAREMVIYLRRDGSQKQDSVYLDYRTHLHPGVHRVQDALISQPEERRTLRELAAIANMSERNLTRIFRETTGISVGEYIEKLRVELAKSLLADSRLSIEAIATRVGFEGARQLRRTLKKLLGVSPSIFRRSSAAK
jgi:transcriptional regulator GlxA family with amidase domain